MFLNNKNNYLFKVNSEDGSFYMKFYFKLR